MMRMEAVKNKAVKNIEELSYKLYKEDWKQSHGITRQMEMDNIQNYYDDCREDNALQAYSYEDYVSEYGYDGECYVCFAEFLENEYLDEEYMKTLLNSENFKIYETRMERNEREKIFQEKIPILFDESMEDVHTIARNPELFDSDVTLASIGNGYGSVSLGIAGEFLVMIDGKAYHALDDLPKELILIAREHGLYELENSKKYEVDILETPYLALYYEWDGETEAVEHASDLQNDIFCKASAEEIKKVLTREFLSLANRDMTVPNRTLLSFQECIQLLDICVKNELIAKAPNNWENILVYRKAGSGTPEGWYSQNLMSAASELATDARGQAFLLQELHKKGIEPCFSEIVEKEEATEEDMAVERQNEEEMER